jgi:hypothetical protein
VSPVRYELDLFIPEDDILHSCSRLSLNLTEAMAHCVGERRVNVQEGKEDIMEKI